MREPALGDIQERKMKEANIVAELEVEIGREIDEQLVELTAEEAVLVAGGLTISGGTRH
jgi:hypothetical protein